MSWFRCPKPEPQTEPAVEKNPCDDQRTHFDRLWELAYAEIDRQITLVEPDEFKAPLTLTGTLTCQFCRAGVEVRRSYRDNEWTPTVRTWQHIPTRARF